MGDTIIRTRRLILSLLDDDDAAFIVELLNEPAFKQFIGDKRVHTLQEARDYLRTGPRANYDKNGFGLLRVGLVDDTPAGICGLLWREGLDQPDLGFAFLQEHWGRGYAREAAAAVLEYAARVLSLTQIIAIVSADNLRSIALLGKLGFHYQDRVRLPGETDDVFRYHLTTIATPQPAGKLRRAAGRDADALSALAFRAKAHWDYDANFMASCKDELSYSREQFDVAGNRTYVYERDGQAVAFYVLEQKEHSGIELEALFVEPDCIGQGIGSYLLRHAQAEAALLGAHRLIIQSDPNAAGFYLAAGAVAMGQRESGSIAGRMLPLFELRVRPARDQRNDFDGA